MLLVTLKNGKNRLYKKASNRACTDMEKILGQMKPAVLYCIAAKGIEYVTLQIDVESMHTARATKSFSWQRNWIFLNRQGGHLIVAQQCSFSVT